MLMINLLLSLVTEDKNATSLWKTKKTEKVMFVIEKGKFKKKEDYFPTKKCKFNSAIMYKGRLKN